MLNPTTVLTSNTSPGISWGFFVVEIIKYYL